MNLHEDLIKISLALILGTVIGLEREVSDKAAGLRTNVLICVGAAIFALLSTKFEVGDPTRMAAQIVSGIGFLGAGAIMRDGDRVTGLTTAATIWIVAAIGVGIGFGAYILSCLATIAVLFIQLVYTQLDVMIDDWRERHTFRILSKLDDASIENIKTIFRHAKVQVLRRKLMKKNNLFYSEWYTSGPRQTQKDMLQKLLNSKDVIEVTY